MKVTFFTFLYEPSLGGGAAQVVKTLAQSLVQLGNQVTVITSGLRKQRVLEYSKGVKIIRFFPPNLYWIAEKENKPIYQKVIWQLIDIWNPLVFRKVRSILEVEAPDLVHVQKLRGLSPAVWRAAKMTQVPKIIHTCQDYELISPEGWLNGRIGRWADNRMILMRPYQYLRGLMSLDVTHASAPSKYVLNKHMRMGYFKNSRCMIVPNSHGYSNEELFRIREMKPRKPKKSLRLLYLGRLVPEKGIWELCKAFKMSLNFFLDMTLDVVGWGILDDKLKKEYGSVENIHFHGSIFGKEKEKLIKNSDLLVVPSIGPEAFGIVLVEAYAFGKPVIASRTGGIPEVVHEGETGYLVNPGDVNDLAEKIQMIAGNPHQLIPMMDACYEAATRYSSDAIIKKYLDFYNAA